jgi:hypothetical protein
MSLSTSVTNAARSLPSEERSAAYGAVHDQVVAYLVEHGKNFHLLRENLAALVLVRGFSTAQKLYVGGDRIQGRSPERKVIANLYGAVEGSYVEEHRTYIPQQIEFLRRAGFLLDRPELSLCPPERLGVGDPKRALIEQIIALHRRYVHVSAVVPDPIPLSAGVGFSGREAPQIEPSPLTKPSRETLKVRERLANAAQVLYGARDTVGKHQEELIQKFAELAEWECVVKDPQYIPKLPHVIDWVDKLRTTKTFPSLEAERGPKPWQKSGNPANLYPKDKVKTVLSVAGSSHVSAAQPFSLNPASKKVLDPRNLQRYDREEMAEYRNSFVVWLLRVEAPVEQIRQTLGRAVEIGVLQREFVDSFVQRLPVSTSLREVRVTRGRSSAKALSTAYDQFRSDYADIGVLAEELCRALGVALDARSAEGDSAPVTAK